MPFDSNKLTLAITVLASLTLAMCCQRRVCSQSPSELGIELATIDTNTRWAFRALSPVTVGSTIVRLGDVVKPLDPNMAGWQRLRRSPIALLPVGGNSMTIQRDRLAQAIRQAEATPAAIDWVGPTEINVVYRRGATEPMAVGAVMQTAHHEPVVNTAPAVAVLTPTQSNRLMQIVRRAIEQVHPTISSAYQIDVDGRQQQLEQLRMLTGVLSIEPRAEVQEGEVPFSISARTVDGEVSTTLNLTLQKHPQIVVPRKSLRRGHLIKRDDLMVVPLPEDKVDPDYVVDFEEVIGMEVRGSLRANQPFAKQEIGPPILIRRGDLIEVRVVGGGITVTTNAKAHGEGAASDLIEVETLNPRKRLVARVVQPGLVEIVTRAPRVTP